MGEALGILLGVLILTLGVLIVLRKDHEEGLGNRHYGPSKLAALTWLARVGFNLGTHAVCRLVRRIARSVVKTYRRAQVWHHALWSQLSARERVGLVVMVGLFTAAEWSNGYCAVYMQ